MTEPQHISKSRVKKVHTCEAQYRMSYVEGHKAPENKHMRKGSELHAAFEHYYGAAKQQGAFDDVKATWEEVTDRIIDILPGATDDLWGNFSSSHVLSFVGFEADRILRKSERLTFPAVEQEVRWENAGFADGVPLMGYVDAIYPAEGFPWTDNDDGVTIVDFKTGSVPDEDYRWDGGIYTELSFYDMVVRNGTDYDVTGLAAYYPQEDEVLTLNVEEACDRGHVEVVEGTKQILRIHDEPDSARAEANPLCCYGDEKGQQCEFYAPNKEVDFEAGVCESDWGCNEGIGPSYGTADELPEGSIAGDDDG